MNKSHLMAIKNIINIYLINKTTIQNNNNKSKNRTKKN